MTTNTDKTEADAIPFEHERRFVPDMNTLPFDYTKFPMVTILQGYLEDKLGTRLRDEHDETQHHAYLLTRKTGHGVSRAEDEVELSKHEFDTMWKDVTCSLSKSRYFITLDDITAEVNIFHGPLEGYAQIEVEFPTHEDAINFAPPAWLGREVTNDKAHNNSSLAKYGKPKD